MSKIFQAKMAAEKPEILFYADIGADMPDGVSADEFREELGKFKNAKEITIRMHSQGGDVFDASAMFGELKRHPARIVMQIDGIAASAASYLAMAADEINIADNGYMMIHEPESLARGRASVLESRASMLRSIIGTVTESYAKRSGQPEDTVAKMMDRETWMTAKDALKLGFADAIVEGPRVRMCVDPRRFRKPPVSLLTASGVAEEYRKRLAKFSKER